MKGMRKGLVWCSLVLMIVISGCVKTSASEETTILLREYSINPERTVLKNSAAPFVIKVKNEGADDHNFVVEELGIDSGIIAPGKIVNVTLNIKESGEFKAKCTLPGHTEAGMVSEVVVQP